MKFVDQTGKVSPDSRFRMLTEKISDDAARIYALYNIPLQPNAYPVFRMLSGGGEYSIDEIAGEIGYSRTTVSRLAANMIGEGLLQVRKEAGKGRKQQLRLSEKGKELQERFREQEGDLSTVLEELSARTTYNLWKAIEEWQLLLAEKSLSIRVKEQKKKRESSKVEVVDYEPRYANAFRELNRQWISAYFKMEESDFKALDKPEEYIIRQGGHILVALYEGVAVGVCALLKMKDPEYDYELAKMAVSPNARGKSIGWLLGQASIQRARAAGAKALYLESNTRLEPAINLYRKLGFQEVFGRPSPYARCNIRMALQLP